jgi:hypothetical protein
MLGSGVASLLALYNAMALRRAGLALVALAVGAAGWAGFGFLVVTTVSAGLKNVALALLLARIVNVGLGALLGWSQWAHVRGHEFLGGRTVVLLHGVLVAIAAVLLIPSRPRLVLEGLWVLLLR